MPSARFGRGLDHLLDSVDAGPQSVAQILAVLPAGTTRGNADAAIRREFRAGRIERATSWREPRLLKAIAERFCRFTLAPVMAAACQLSAGRQRSP